MPSDVRSVALNLTNKELIFLQKVTRQEYHFITDEEQEARLRLPAKLHKTAESVFGVSSKEE
jgi:hypothetical protein